MIVRWWQARLPAMACVTLSAGMMWGCDDEGAADQTAPEPRPDAAMSDGAAGAIADSTVPDEGLPDEGLPDEGFFDASQPDAAQPDAAQPDANLVDAGLDADLIDDGIPDADLPDVEPPDEGSPDEGLPDAGPPPLEACDPPLSLSPTLASVLPLDLVSFRAAGGTGDWSFSLAEDNSGALLNAVTGAYLSGDQLGTTDRVTLTDRGCIGEASAEIYVVRLMQVAPEAIAVTPRDRFTFQVSEGSGEYGFEVIFAGAGGVIDDEGRYSAPAEEGLDVVRVTDVETGQEVDVEIEVRADVVLTATPPEVAIAVGERHPLVVLGGSGAFDVDGGEGLVSADGAWLIGERPGRAQLRLTDRFTGRTAALGVTVLGAQQAELPRVGDGFLGGPIVAPGDLNGDGFDDVVVGWPEADIEAFNGGAVFVFTGGPEGPGEASQIIAGDGRTDEMGWGLAVADVTGDGEPDLVVGAHQADVNRTDNGAIYIYAGIEGGLFDETPTRVIAGPQGGGRMGRGLAVCDFNGDGRLDLAAGAFQAEDQSADPRANNQGGVYVFLGAEGGLPEDPDQAIWGTRRDGDLEAWSPAANLQLGRFLAAGDFDGDGRCDLAAHALNYRAPTSIANSDGIVALYRGVAPGPLSPGGLTSLPVRAWAPTGVFDGGSQFGRRLAFGDVDGDGREDLLASHHLANGFRPDGGNLNNNGALRVFLGTDLTDEPAPGFLPPAATADWSYAGEASNRQVGLYPNVGDANGDGRLDIISGDFLAPGPDNLTNAGRVSIFYGPEGQGLPATVADVTYTGEEVSERFGQTVAVAGNLDGDGLPDLVSQAGRTDAIGYDVGQIYFVPGADDAPRRALGVPGRAAGAQLGRGAAVIGDVDADGLPDLAAGAPQGEVSGQNGINQGAVFLYRGTADGNFERRPFRTLAQFTGHSGGDLFGWAVSPAGDFTGDGIDDFWVVAQRDDKPNDPNDDYYEPVRCEGSRNDSGAAYLFAGGEGGPSEQPAFVVFGLRNQDRLSVLSGPVDVDGDGRSDVVIGFPEGDHNGRGNSGGFMVVHGRDIANAAAGRPEVLCDPEHFLGGASDLQLGRSIVGLGDLSGDGCEEFAVGAYLSDHAGRNNEGAVYVFRGWGNVGCPESPRAFGMESGAANDQVGWALASADADGDGLTDLAVTGVNAIAETGGRGGSVWFVPGTRLRTLLTSATAQPLPSESIPAQWVPLIPEGGPGSRIRGLTNGARMGSGLFMFPGSDAQPGLLAVGSPFGAQGGVDDSGGVRIFEVGPEGVRPEPWLIFGGEPSRVDGRIGEWLHGLWNPALRSRVLIIGGYLGQGYTGVPNTSIDQGAVYSLPLP
ncbi:MAG: FG-GAP-like repeat-containing protein [Bradymonadia bacterium]